MSRRMSTSKTTNFWSTTGKLTLPFQGGVAQLVERLGRIEEARGSIPLTST